jgi:hypothetical protein
MALGNAAAARVRLIVWCRDCGHRSEADPAENTLPMIGAGQSRRFRATVSVSDQSQSCAGVEL